jgi:hypothetical protein
MCNVRAQFGVICVFWWRNRVFAYIACNWPFRVRLCWFCSVDVLGVSRLRNRWFGFKSFHPE